MKSLHLLAGCAIFAISAPTACFATSNWDGTWKLNEAKSKMTGSTFTVTKAGSLYTMDDGSMKFNFACDGKDYPVIGNYTTTCMENGRTSTTSSKLSGKVQSTTKHEISADGKTLTDVTSGTRPDGTTYTDKESYSRTAGDGTGLAGTWKNTKSSNSAPQVFMLKVNGDVLHFENPGYKSTTDANLDGTPAPIKGPTVPAGVMITNKSDGRNKVVTVVTLNGKEMGKDVMTLSADGKTITDVSWIPGKESEKQTFVYDKQ